MQSLAVSSAAVQKEMAWKIKWTIDTYIEGNGLDDEYDGFEFDYLHGGENGDKVDGKNLDSSRGSMDGYHSA